MAAWGWLRHAPWGEIAKAAAARVPGLVRDLRRRDDDDTPPARPAASADVPPDVAQLKFELELVKTHANAGHDVLKDIEFPWPVAQIALQHHERIDGSGYPAGLKGDQIIREARIIAVADVVESMATHRPYRPALGIDKALAEIERGSGTLYDPEAAQACLRLFREGRFQLPA